MDHVDEWNLDDLAKSRNRGFPVVGLLSPAFMNASAPRRQIASVRAGIAPCHGGDELAATLRS